MKHEIYAFIFDQKGLIAGLGVTHGVISTENLSLPAKRNNTQRLPRHDDRFFTVATKSGG